MVLSVQIHVSSAQSRCYRTGLDYQAAVYGLQWEYESEIFDCWIQVGWVQKVRQVQTLLSVDLQAPSAYCHVRWIGVDHGPAVPLVKWFHY